MSQPTAAIASDRHDIEQAIAGRTIVDALAATVQQRGDSPAFSDKVGADGTGWRTLTWRELRETALDVAAALVDLGVGQGDRVAIMATNRIEHVLADIAAVHAGAVPMSVYNTLAPDQVGYIAGHAHPRVVVLETADHLARWSDALDSDPGITVVVLDAALASDLEGTLTWATLVTRGRELRKAHEAEIARRVAAIDPEDPITILYTSGTTGNPKGVVISHRNVLFEVDSSNRTAGLDDSVEHVGVSYLPFAHIAERVLGIYIPQVRGGHIHLVGDPALLVAALGEVRPTEFFGVPRVWEKIQTGLGGLLAMETDESKRQAVTDAMAVGLEYVESLQVGHETSLELQQRYAAAEAAVLGPVKSLLGLDRVTWTGSASAPMPLETARFFAGLGLAIYDIYGMTETTGSVTSCGPGSFKLGTVGRAQPGLEIAIAEDGEVLTRGPVTTGGYHHNPEATADLIDDQGWIHTGDIGELDDDGFLRIVDRKKEMIITSAGKNIAPSNIENLLKESPLVGHALAYGEGRPYVVAILTLDPDVAPVVAGRLGLPRTGLEDLASSPEILAVVGEAVEAANARLSRPEQVKRWTLLPREWTAESEELTPTLKLKRRVVHSTYAEELEALYSS